MNLIQVKGNTWVLEGIEYIPLYRLEDGRCILLDTGLGEEQEELEAALLAYGLKPVGILCSHAHVDHCGNNAFFQRKYGAQVALTAPEAGMCCSILNLKCYCLVVSPNMAQEEMANMVHTADVIIPEQDGPFSFQGVEFQIIHTPGHSPAHVSVITPDGVCYVGDALLSQEMLGAKLPYALAHHLAHESREKLKAVDADVFLMAHRGMCDGDQIAQLVEDNHTLIDQRAKEVLELISRPMNITEIYQGVCRRFQLLSRRPRRSLRFERNTRFFIEYLVDQGALEMEVVEGVVWYSRAEQG